jgi:prevent-host-death family protein
MDQTITASQANQRFSQMLREVETGRSFIVTSHGRPVARLVPVGAEDQTPALGELLAFLETLPRREAGAWRRDDLYR